MQLTPEQAGLLQSWLGEPEAGAEEAAETIARPGAGSAGPGTPERVGVYRIIRSLGRGGMGEVFLAEDERLQRRVALKAIRAERRLDRDARLRFLREARVLSSLDHPGICRIHDYLEGPDGDYLVLEYIEGESLAWALRTAGAAEKLDIAEQIADVLAAAHAAGIVHRDLKPDNVMLRSSGAVKVLDFGLARSGEDAVGPPTNAAGDDAGEVPAPPADPEPDGTRSIFLTQRAGAIAGTPLYMSPEQARGEIVSAASDMYSLGLLLQELFTGSRPHRSGLGIDEVLARARTGVSEPVTGINRDVATLIERLKSPEAGARPTATETARRLRWVRRKPQRRLRRLAIAAGVALAALAGLKYTLDLRQERTQAVAARDDAEDLLTFMIEDLRAQLEPVGRLDVLDAVGDKALDYFSRLPERDLGDDDLHRRAGVLRLIGQVRLAEGDFQKAEAAFRESLALDSDAVKRNPRRADWIVKLAESHFYIGQIHYERGDLDAALAQFDIYRDLAERLVELDPADPAWQMERAYAHQNHGAFYERLGEVGRARREIEGAIEIKRELVARDPDNPRWQRDLANSLSWLATNRQGVGDLETAEASLTQELELRRGLHERQHPDAHDSYSLTIAHGELGDFHTTHGRYGDAIDQYRRMQRLARRLGERDPANTRWRRQVALAHRYVAGAEQSRGRRAVALRELRAGEVILREMVAQEPTSSDWRLQLVRTNARIVSIALDREQWAEAADEIEAAIDVLAPLTEGDPADPTGRIDLAGARYAHAVALQYLEGPSAARRSVTEAAAMVEPLATGSDILGAKLLLARARQIIGRLDLADGDLETIAFRQAIALVTPETKEHPGWRERRAVSHRYLAHARFARGDLDGALEHSGRVEVLVDLLLAEAPESLEWKAMKAMARTDRGAILGQRAELEAALEAIDASIALKRELLEREPDLPRRRRSLADSLAWRAWIERRDGDADAAYAALSEELGLRQGLVTGGVTHPADPLHLGACHGRLAEVLQTQGRAEEAAAHRAEAAIEQIPAWIPWPSELTVRQIPRSPTHH